jgi:hypothetical protein
MLQRARRMKNDRLSPDSSHQLADTALPSCGFSRIATPRWRQNVST